MHQVLVGAENSIEALPAQENSRLVAIVLIDAVGSSAAMNRNEVGAMREIERALVAFSSDVTAGRGRVLNYTGDGALAIFDSVATAVDVSLRFQESLTRSFPSDAASIGFRAGVHLGEVFELEERAFGDSLNLTERVQRVAPIGGVCVSDLVYRAIQGRLDFSFEYLGPQSVKGRLEPS